MNRGDRGFAACCPAIGKAAGSPIGVNLGSSAGEVKPIGVADEEHAIGRQQPVDRASNARAGRGLEVDQEVAAEDHVVGG